MQRSVSGTWRAPCLDAPYQLLLLAGREHGRTIPLTAIAISIAPGRARSRSRLEPSCCRSQALYLFVHLLGFLVELHELRFFGCIVAAQLVEHFADGEFIYFGHRNLLRAIKVRKHRHPPINAFTSLIW